MLWIMFPEGTDRITVERQEFSVEVTDISGRGYSRMPEHFVPRVLAVGGFRAADPPEGTELGELGAPIQHDPLRDGAISDLARENDVLRQRVMELNSDHSADEAAIRAITQERDGYRDEVNALKSANSFLTERLQEFEDEQATKIAAEEKIKGKKS